jgi:hypothetical protein
MMKYQQTLMYTTSLLVRFYLRFAVYETPSRFMDTARISSKAVGQPENLLTDFC